MKITIHPTVIYRVPRFSLDAEIKSSWPELIAAIQISSPDFYEIIKDVTPDQIEGLPQTVMQTIWKYFNRAKFRATPFGTFAAFGCAQLDKQSGTPALTIEQDLVVHRFQDWSIREELTITFDEMLEKDERLFSNSTYYRLGRNIRYVYVEDGAFQLSEIRYSEELAAILQLCLKPVKISSLLRTLASEDKQHLLSQIKYLLSVQLLLDSGQPNIIGQDYFKRRDFSHRVATNDYILSERRPIEGCIDAGIFRHVPALVEQLNHFIPEPEGAVLDTFISRFVKRFEQQEIPLMIALDPEAGVGYDELEQAGTDEKHITNLGLFAESKKEDGLKKLLIKSVVGVCKSHATSIDLEQLDPPYPQIQIPLANTISLMCRVSDGKVHIDNLGGATATSLNGRFTLASDQVLSLCRELADIEQQANPEVIFFDVGYTAENKIDNINRRKSVYPYELNLLNYDTSEVPLALTDIFISVRGKEIVLWSKQLGKRLIPRLSSAYNYQRSDLSVFRLLCDVQHQGLQVNLNLSLESLLPDMDYYPELRFRNIILSPRKWKFRAKQIGSYADFLQHTSELKDCHYVRTGTGDQTLCFDLRSKNEMEILYKLLSKEKQLSIEEIHIPSESIINDKNGLPYLGQFILNLMHHESLYRPVVSMPNMITPETSRLFPPGGEWLYFEIYCHPYRADELLQEKIQPFLDTHGAKIKTWFFIRYNEGGNHIRLRLRLIDPKSGYLLTGSLSEALKEEIESGIVGDLRISLYRREVDRYGWVNIEDVEAHFACCSRFVMELLSYAPDAFTKYRLCLQLLEMIAGSGIFEDEVLHRIIRRNSEAFNKEHNLGTEDFRKLNKEYKLYRNSNFDSFNPRQLEVRRAFQISLLSILSTCPEHQKASLLSDLLHMHINRLFSDHQRHYEMVFYYFLVKDLQRLKAMQ